MIETISAATRKGMTDLCIFFSMVAAMTNVKKRNRRNNLNLSLKKFPKKKNFQILICDRSICRPGFVTQRSMNCFSARQLAAKVLSNISTASLLGTPTRLEGCRPFEFGLMWTEVAYGHSSPAVSKGCVVSRA